MILLIRGNKSKGEICENMRKILFSSVCMKMIKRPHVRLIFYANRGYNKVNLECDNSCYFEPTSF